MFQEVVEVIPEEQGGPRRTTRETSLRFKAGVEVIPSMPDGIPEVEEEGLGDTLPAGGVAREVDGQPKRA